MFSVPIWVEEKSMSVTNLVTWQIKPGRQAETMAAVANAKRVFEGLGARVRVYQPMVAGPNVSNLSFLTEFDTFSAYAKFSTAVRDNAEWQQQLAVINSAEAGATMVASTLSVTIPGLEVSGAAAKGAGPRVVTASLVQPLPGKQPGAVADLKELAPILTKVGGRFSARLITVGGPATGQIAIVSEADDLAAWGATVDKLPTLGEFQAWQAKSTSSMTLVSRAVVIQVL
jgi:hypothetical protein